MAITVEGPVDYHWSVEKFETPSLPPEKSQAENSWVGGVLQGFT